MTGAAFGISPRNPFGIPAGVRIPGGCDDCHAYQVMLEQPDQHGNWHMQVWHDDTCWTLARKRGRA